MKPNADLIRLFAVDLDDTLLNNEWRVSHRNRDALAKLAATGVEVCIISGRMPDSIRRIIDSLKFVNYIGSYHGAIIEHVHTGRVVASRRLSQPGLADILEWKARKAYRCIYFAGPRALAEADDEVVAYYRERTGATVLFPDRSKSAISNMDISKIVLYERYSKPHSSEKKNRPRAASYASR